MRVVPQRNAYCLQHALDVLHHFVVPDAQSAVTSATQIRVTTLIV
jgi:hypothetical protein